ncbi:uncharacterized protein LOC134839508 [Symsagittifera roscoffensis]|uniref:uncharacterized protein LOC134839508 n=1 Tax=Symsagittifera roscoffensis TaxID=84072 RepID=UPI00307C850B
MILPDYFFCDQLNNATFMRRIHTLDDILPFKIPLIDMETCITLNAVFYLLLISGSFGTLLNFVIASSYVVKFFRETSEFNQSDLLIISMAVLDFLSALMLLTGTAFMVNQPIDSSRALMEISCSIVYGGYTLGSRTTYLMMLLIAVTRYVAICRPQDYYTWFSRPKLNFYLGLLFVISFFQVAAQQVISCHLPLKWFQVRDGSFRQIYANFGDHYPTFKLMWQVNVYEKFILLMIIISIISTLYIKIINHMNNITPIQLINSDDESQVRTIRRTFILYLLYLYFIMFPQSGLEMFFTYELLNEDLLTKNPNELYKNLRILMEVQFIYSSIYVLNPITVFWLNPNHGPTIRDFFLTLFEAVGLYVQDEDSTDYRWRWQKKSVIPLLINDLERVDTNDSVKLINLEEFE